jgi:hypothetical protein
MIKKEIWTQEYKVRTENAVYIVDETTAPPINKLLCPKMEEGA